ncbi:alpha/beta fold hydrolase [Pseudidiomarina aestuarii]|uniref:alpha/beta fold hydrolase n=1 Tax=Pseudidiomarina aestuarii TaxID=624146 RepID=UPI001474201D|nr:alpha/beta fold hydrolase [Pseudidiomarina aestuarii]
MSENVPFHHQDHSIQLTEGQLLLRSYGSNSGPPVLVLGGISGGRDIFTSNGSGWWQGLAEAIPAELNVISLDYAGGSGDSTVTPVPQRVEGHAILIEQALQRLGIQHLRAIVGGSFGGVIALELARRGKLEIGGLAIIGAAHRPTAQALMLRALQREYIALAEQAGQTERGVQLARALAMLSYRSADGMDTYHPQGTSAVDYILSRSAQTVAKAPSRARNFFTAFGPALDQYRINPTEISVPTLLVGFDSDQLVSAQVLNELAEKLPRCAGLHLLPSSYGHDGFIKNTASYASICHNFILELAVERS